MGAVARDVIEIEHVRWRRRPADTDDDAREDARVLEPYLPQQDRRASFYLTVRQRFVISTAGALSWMAISTALAVPWSDELASLLGAPAAWLLITLIALVPGFLNTHLVLSLLLDRPRQLDEVLDLLPRARLVAAEHGGKAAALNLGLAQVRTPVVVTMDADTCLHPEALRRLVTRLVTAPRYGGRCRHGAHAQFPGEPAHPNAGVGLLPRDGIG